MNNGEKQKKDPLQVGGTLQRQVDKLANESLPLLGKSWVFIARTRVKTWQGLFMLAFVSGAFVSFVWSVSLEIESLSKASGQATLSMDSPQATSGVINVAQDETFDVELLVDTGGVDAVAVRAMVTYNQADFQLTGWNTSGSIFATGNTCVYQGNPCQIIDDDAANGKISLTLAKPSPGVNSHSGLVATLTFKALRNVTSTTNNILYTFSGANNETDSDVIEEGGIGNDLLNGVSGIRALVGAPVCTDYNYSNWGTCQPNNTQTRTVVSGIPTGCSGGATPDLTQACTYVPPTCTSFNASAWGACQPNNTQTRTVTGVPSGCTGGNPPASVQDCTYTGGGTTCTSFNTSAWGDCQSNNTRTRTVTGVPSGCSGGTPPASSEACTYTPPTDNTCTSFEYSAWGNCTKGKQTRSITSSSPSGCTGGSPVVEQSCKGRKVKIMDTTVNFSNSEKILTSEKTISFSGTDAELSGGMVEIYREGKLKTSEKVGSDGKWSLRVKEKKNGTYEYRVRYVNASGAEIEKSSEYRVKIDSEDPEITDLPLFLMKARGEKVWWMAKDNDEMDHYRYTFLGKSKSTKSKSFNIPADAPTGIHTFQLTAYDEAGNRTVRRILIRVR
jgi:hypothetical protein